MSDPLLASLEQKYQLPPGILGATEHVESSGHDVTSSAGANGYFQLMPDTARKLGVNPHDRIQAADGAARLWRQNLDSVHGDVDQAAMLYHAGPDRRGWGPKTQAYPGKILAALSGGAQPTAQPASAPVTAAPSDPIEAAIMGQPAGNSAAATHDPIEAAIIGGNTAGSGTQPQPDNHPLPGGGQIPSGSPDRGLDAGGRGTSPGARGQGQEATGGISAAIGDFANGVSEGWGNLQADLVGLGARATDAVGISHGELDRIDKARTALKAGTVDPMFNNPDGWSRPIGNFTGQAIAGAPLTELKPFEAMGAGGKIGAVLNRYLDMGAQGAAFGAIGSGGRNIEDNAALGAALAPGIGAAADRILPPVLAGIGAATKPARGAADDLAAAIRKQFSDVGESPHAEWGNSPLEQSLGRAKPPAGVAAVNENGAPFREMGHVGGTDYPMYGDSAASPAAPDPATAAPSPAIDPVEVGNAMGSRANANSIESNRDLPPEVSAHAQKLVEQGVPLRNALQEADLEHLGVPALASDVDRTFAAHQAVDTISRLQTPEADAIRAQQAAQTQAAHDTVSGMVRDLAPDAKPPAAGDATHTAGQSLATASEAERASVNAKYKAAREADPEALIEPKALYGLLNSPEARAVPDSTPEGGVLASVRNAIDLGQAAQDSKIMPRGMAPDAIDNISKMANRKFGADGGVNYWAGKVSKATADDLDQLDSMGPLWRDARAAHRDWAQKYSDPAGIAKLIAKDPRGGLVNDDRWSKAEATLLGPDPKPMIEVVRQLKANGDQPAIDHLKARVIQMAYERSSNTAADQGKNSVINGKLFAGALDKIGKQRLGALFTPAELATLGSHTRALRLLSEPVLKSVNTSGSAAALINHDGPAAQQGKALAEALANRDAANNNTPAPSKLKAIAKIGGTAALMPLTHHLGGEAADLLLAPAHMALDHFSKQSAAAKLAKVLAGHNDEVAAHVRAFGSPEAARAQVRADTAARKVQSERALAAANRKALARGLSNRLAPASSNHRGQ